jgi:spermidine/putrescine transport system permease protein
MRGRALAGLYWGGAAALALPLALVVLTSLSGGTLVGFPLGPPSLRWYAAALADPAWRRAFALSAWLALGAGALSVVVGGWVALAAAALPRRWMRAALLGGALLPLVTPGIVHAVALRAAAAAVGLGPGPGAVLLGHVVHAAPFAVLMVGARRAALPPALLDAARDLGAGPAAAFAHVMLPWLRPSLLGAAALAALTSFDDFIRSFFLGGYDPTLPVLVFARLRSGLTPEINAVCTLMVLLVSACGALAERLAPRA